TVRSRSSAEAIRDIPELQRPAVAWSRSMRRSDFIHIRKLVHARSRGDRLLAWRGKPRSLARERPGEFLAPGKILRVRLPGEQHCGTEQRRETQKVHWRHLSGEIRLDCSADVLAPLASGANASACPHGCARRIEPMAVDQGSVSMNASPRWKRRPEGSTWGDF